MCKAKYFIEKMNYASRCKPVYSKNTLRVMKSVCAVKFSRSLNVTLPFPWNLIESKRLTSTIISNELN